jgi:hypothetical protein
MRAVATRYLVLGIRSYQSQDDPRAYCGDVAVGNPASRAEGEWGRPRR